MDRSNCKGQAVIESVLAVALIVTIAYFGSRQALALVGEFRHDYSQYDGKAKTMELPRSAFNKDILMFESKDPQVILRDLGQKGWKLDRKLSDGDQTIYLLRKQSQMMILNKGMGFVCKKDC